MGRRKAKPHRSVGILENHRNSIEESDSQNASSQIESVEIDKPFIVQVDRTSWDSDEHMDISEIIVTNLKLNDEFTDFEMNDEVYVQSRFMLRLRLCNVNENLSRMLLGHWPVLSANDIYLEYVLTRESDDGKASESDVIVSGCLDGPDEGVSSLVHLANLKFLTLRPVLGVKLSKDAVSVRVRVEMLKVAFNACESLLDCGRQLWKKSMINVMTWMRPEVTSSEARYGVSFPEDMDIDEDWDSCDWKHGRFDVAGFYEAIKPSKNNPVLEHELPGLLPELRPYQRRAAYWMVQREKGLSQDSVKREQFFYVSPFCVAVDFLDTCSQMFYNPFSGNISVHPVQPPSYVFGGILADEMGLGKTVELLACVFTHRKSESEGPSSLDIVSDDNAMTKKISLKRVKRERVECICGAMSESWRYNGLWVQCDICDAWQHDECVGFSATKKAREPGNISKQHKGKRKKRSNIDVTDTDGDYICQLCSELIQATSSPLPSGATLIICPASILSQWNAEILRHTTPGSLRVCIYEGVKNSSLSNGCAVDINELLNADIVLTTYDVLKEDLSHDSDRHEGDRRLMRYDKRYPVIPTPLTRIFWWRICLDEAQMVENNAAAATEMALRLYTRHRWCITGTPVQRKLDDLYGLLRFLKAGPFDVSRWWIEAIRDPYERKNMGAMEFTHHVFRQLMWRSSKSHVADELQLPPQEECLSWLSLSPVEEHFYQRQHETCVNYAHEVLESFKTLRRNGSGSVSDAVNDLYITHAEAAKLLNSLLKLRQACCHPQVGSSGLRSLQQTPMTMDDVLSVLISKTKIEGEDALRTVVSSLNGLAGIAIIRGEHSQAVSLYKEALSLAEEHYENFRLDPLLHVHLLHNLTEILELGASNLVQRHGGQIAGVPKEEPSYVVCLKECDQHIMKNQNTEREGFSNLDIDAERNFDVDNSSEDGLRCGKVNAKVDTPSRYACEEGLIKACENVKQKYLLVFYSKLSVAREEFQKSYQQVNDSFKGRKSQNAAWWLEALDQIEHNQESTSELRRKIENAILGNHNSSKASRTMSFSRSISTLKYYVQTGLDSLEACRKKLLDQLIEIDRTMENPRCEDVERVRHCKNCYINADGPLCVHCELDELFQVYEARLFLLKRGNDEGIIISAEEAVDMQKKKTQLNHFYWNLTEKAKGRLSSRQVKEETTKKRDAGKMFVVSRTPSELEIILGVIRSYFKAQVGRDGMSEANQHLLYLESMRKEYPHARSLAIAQAQVLHAHDEIKMATSRLRLRENDDDTSIDALSLEELDVADVQNSSEKFISMAALARIRGKLHYLQSLMVSKQKDQDAAALLFCTQTQRENQFKTDEEICPVCQEKLDNQRMVFQCGHVTCPKCLFAITEREEAFHGKALGKWVMCPTCRQHSDFGNIAFADDRQEMSLDQSGESFEASITVQGSYGTKIEAITRRILWIKSTDPAAKVLVFSSWNDVLDVLEHAFTTNQISYVRMKGGRKSQAALSIFKGERNDAKMSDKASSPQAEPKSVQVMLILIHHGANGLNLLEAQHVILVEPLLNPGAEAQAISRVHRIGQKNKTLIHRFIVKNTVEEGIYKLNKSRSPSSFISPNKKNQDQPVLTLKDVESLFAVVPKKPAGKESEEGKQEAGCLMHLPPYVAAAIAAERRQNGCSGT